MQGLETFAGLLLALATTADGGAAAGTSCEGRVLLHGGQAAVPGALVSDGRGVVATDQEGRYRIDMPAHHRELFVIAPDGFAVPMAADGLPAFWRSDCGDFRLTRDANAAQETQRVLVFADPQTSDAQEVDYYARAIVAPARGESEVALGITLGDVTNDVAALYPALNAATTSIGVPWLHLAGNHDVDPGAQDDGDALTAFRAVYGPDTFAWQSSQASFVVLDNVVSMPGQRPAYIGGLRDDQFAFLEAYLPHAPRDRLLVVAAHIPWFDTAAAGRPGTLRTSDRERLFALLQDFPNVLLLSAHRHTQRQFFHGGAEGWHGAAPLHEYNVGAASGAYWSGMRDAQGIPVATMADGTPRGYAVLDIGASGDYRLAWRPTGVDGDDPAITAAMALHAPRVLRRGAYPAWGVFANVWMGHDGTRVEYRIGEREWAPMQKVLQADPRLRIQNTLDDLSDGLRGLDRSPEAELSTHLWRGALDTRLPLGVHRVEVRAFDDAGGEHRAVIDYRLQDWRE
ncbi:calcineurin phosphoesterase [Luteimonas aestuarii]|uniref:Calcineurin phosphoesterase n=1 Tax=Luteimonas aestuarii TaxID=453837 RepID=A0A4R5TKA9_9GAMM|nr:calcineurin-like phosphoesterase C-terminal domain-containing protein [Luteimonas aestuarii]TDK22300.1 calcineurin phosphoesterase [Luteimonas aestuarii]